MLKQKLLLSCCFGAGWLALAAQPTLQNNVFPGIGDQLTWANPDTTGVEPGGAGADQTWDFSDLQVITTVGPAPFVDAAATPYAAEFPLANLCNVIPLVQFTGDTAFAYYRVATNELSYTGVAEGGGLLQFSDPEILLQTPMTFGGEFSDHFARHNNYADNTLQGTASKTVTYDAYGTLITPAGTFPNAMRLHTMAAYRDTSWLFAGYSINIHTDQVYEWYLANQPGSLLTITYSEGVTTTYIQSLPPIVMENVPSKLVRFVSQVSVGTGAEPERLAGISGEMLLPNPATDLLCLQFSSEKPDVPLQLQLLDASGRVLVAQDWQTFAGQNKALFPVSDLASGAYFLRLSDGRTARTLSWQKR